MKEEAYDTVKDRIAMAGGDPSHPKKTDATTQPYRHNDKVKGQTVLQKRSEKKYGKGATALDIVKAKIKKSGGKIMGEEKLGEAKVDNKIPDYKRSSARNARYGNPYGSLALGGGIQRDRRDDHYNRRGKKTKGVKEGYKGTMDMSKSHPEAVKALEKNIERFAANSYRNVMKKKKEQGVKEETVAKDMCKKNCGCGQDPCITYGEQKQKPAAARPADKVMVSEVSKKTLGSYVKKAATEIGTSAMKGDYKKMQKRHKGVLDASDKLQKEELKMTKKEYSKIHKDFKSDDPKKPRTTKYVPGKGTVSMPVKIVDEGKGYQPEITHSKLGDGVKAKKKKDDSKYPPHLQGDVIGKMRKAFAHTNEGTSYGLYKGDGKVKFKLNKPSKDKKVQSFKKFKAGQEPSSTPAPDMSESSLATARKNIGRDPKKKSCWKGYTATTTKMKGGKSVPDCKKV